MGEVVQQILDRTHAKFFERLRVHLANAGNIFNRGLKCKGFGWLQSWRRLGRRNDGACGSACKCGAILNTTTCTITHCRFFGSFQLAVQATQLLDRVINTGATIRNSIIMGADYYETDPTQVIEGVPPNGLPQGEGRSCPR